MVRWEIEVPPETIREAGMGCGWGRNECAKCRVMERATTYGR